MSNILSAPWQCRCKSADQMSELMAALDKAGYEAVMIDSFEINPIVFSLSSTKKAYSTTYYASQTSILRTYDPNQIIDALQNT